MSLHLEEKPHSATDFRSQLSGWFHSVKKETWILIVCFGLLLMILAIPSGGGFSLTGKTAVSGVGQQTGTGRNGTENLQAALPGTTADDTAGSQTEDYEAQLEERVRKLLSHVEGVGAVDVMLVLESSGEVVYHQNGKTDDSFLLDTSPLVEKELRPAIAGMVISAEGGGSLAVQSKIITAMSALFHIPESRIQVLKRESRP